uniref:Uncharacterized protein n=1 Tax=Arundo donax TaxID=35708 RepID=A0A0A9HB38_ARUDO
MCTLDTVKHNIFVCAATAECLVIHQQLCAAKIAVKLVPCVLYIRLSKTNL